ncbi:MFS transporter [Helicobacter didelphidarum]|uniref:MFS transporter n=1 Tax=Helicobacter didelphidarum TaxID=2040648 RepID=A0A3D8IRC8_9HELI|nr:MFS transporter [Helicobacter didelphidarum]RDU67151.1 MFS transporter [Helicobacter didelphidarum]
MNVSNLLVWLNFFVADVRDGLGPFMGVFLQNHGFGEAQIGLIHTITHLLALSLSIPFGILIDKTPHKKPLIAFCIALIMIFCILNLFFPHFYFTLLAQSAIALSGVFLAPAFAAITLGIVGYRDYPLQCARNEAYKHAGSVFGAVLCFIFAFYFGIASVFVITACLGGISLVILGCIKQGSIDDKIACGASSRNILPSGFFIVFFDKSVLFVSFLMFCFHLSNAAMLPLLSQRAFTLGIDTSGAHAAATIIIAQTTMIFTAFLSGKYISADSQNPSNIESHKTSDTPAKREIYTQNLRVYFWLLCACFVALIVRGVIAAFFDGIGGMVFVQVLDGVGAGIIGVILPIFIMIILKGSGHINTGLSIALTSGGIGGALSGSIAGYFAQYYGYDFAYLFLASIAFAGLLILFVGHRAIRIFH